MTQVQGGTASSMADGEPPGGGHSEAAIRRETILVVHSYRSLREAIAHTLRHNRYTVLEAERPHLGVGLLRASDAALILVELAAGQEGGADLVADLALTGAGVPVIGLTSSWMPAEETRALGLCEMLVMPVEQRDLLAAVNRTLEAGRRAAAEGPSGSVDAQCRLPLDDHLRAEHISLSFTFPDETRIELQPGNDGRVRGFSARLAVLGLEPEVLIDGGDLLFRYEPTVADALVLDAEGGAAALQRRLIEAFPELGLRPEVLRRRLEVLAGEFRRLQRLAS